MIRYEMLVERVLTAVRTNQQPQSGQTEKLESNERICRVVSAEEVRGGYGGKDLQKRKVLSLE